MKYLVLGAGGMAGHMIANYLIEQGENVEGLERRNLNFCNTYVQDVTDFERLKTIIDNGNYDYIINCIGVLNQAAEDNKALAIMLNSYLPHFLADYTKEKKTSIIHMSTDCVFSGSKGLYTENDFPDGKSFYDRTKALGELRDNKNLTFRNSIIGPDMNENGIGLFNWFMKQESEVDGYEKSIWTGVTTLVLAKAMYVASKVHLYGLYNLVNNVNSNKYELCYYFNKFSEKELLVNKVNGIVQNKSLFRTRNDFDFTVPTYETMIKEMIDWVNNHRNLYPHYFKGE